MTDFLATLALRAAGRLPAGEAASNSPGCLVPLVPRPSARFEPQLEPRFESEAEPRFESKVEAQLVLGGDADAPQTTTLPVQTAAPPPEGEAPALRQSQPASAIPNAPTSAAPDDGARSDLPARPAASAAPRDGPARSPAQPLLEALETAGTGQDLPSRTSRPGRGAHAADSPQHQPALQHTTAATVRTDIVASSREQPGEALLRQSMATTPSPAPTARPAVAGPPADLLRPDSLPVETPTTHAAADRNMPLGKARPAQGPTKLPIAEHGEAPPVSVTIGRIEIEAASPPAPAPRAPSPRTRGFDGYARARRGCLR